MRPKKPLNKLKYLVEPGTEFFSGKQKAFDWINRRLPKVTGRLLSTLTKTRVLKKDFPQKMIVFVCDDDVMPPHIFK